MLLIDGMETDEQDTTWQPLSLATGRLLLKVKHYSRAEHRDQEAKRKKHDNKLAGSAGALSIGEVVNGN